MADAAPNPQASHENLKTIAMLIAGLIALWLSFVMGWCTIYKIYIDVPMLLVISNIVTGITSCITTVLVGRTIAQLNQGADTQTTMTQTTQTVTTPKPSQDAPLVITKQPEVAVSKAAKAPKPDKK
jgi:hypothetical protein